MAGLRVVVAALLLLGIPALARAQAGWYLTPSLSLSEEYQSNIFGTSSDEVSDFVTRIAPGLTLGYFSEPLTFSFNYSIDAEIFAENSELNNFGDNQRAGLFFRYLPNPRWTLGLTGSFVQSEDSGNLLIPTAGLTAPAGPTPTPTPGAPPSPGAAPPPAGTLPTAPAGTVPVVPGVDVGRTRTRYVVVAPTVSYEYDLRTRLDGGYTYTWTDVENGAEDQSHALTAGVSRELTPRDRGHLRDLLNIFVQEESGTSLSNAVLVGWSRQLAERTTLFLEAGPRINDEGDWGVDATARLDHQFGNGARLPVLRAHRSARGRPRRPLDDGYREPRGHLHARSEPSALRRGQCEPHHLRRRQRRRRRYDLRDRPLGRVPAAGMAERAGVLPGVLPGRSSGDIQHHTVGIALDLSYPFRLY